MSHQPVNPKGRPRLTVRAAILSEGRWLLLRAADPGPDWYVLPGGGVHENEYVRTALVREILEELGAEIRIGPLIAIGDRIPRKLVEGSSRWVHTVSLIFLAEIVSGTPHLAPGMDRDIDDFQWVTTKGLADVDLYPKALKARLIKGGLTMGYRGEPLFLETF